MRTQVFQKASGSSRREEEETEMRVLVLAKEGNQTAATPPTPEAMAEYQKFNGELVKAGLLVGGGPLSPRFQVKRDQVDRKKRLAHHGELAEGKGLRGGEVVCVAGLDQRRPARR